MTEVPKTQTDLQLSDGTELSLKNRLDIIDEGIRRKYLARLTEMPIAPIYSIKPLEEDLINNVRLFKITEMVYQKGEPVTDKFTTVFNTLSTYNTSVFILLDSDGNKTDFYLGVRNNEQDGSISKRSTVTLSDTLKNTLIGHFPGSKIKNEDRQSISVLSNKLLKQQNMASVSVVGTSKTATSDEHSFVQGLEKLALALQGRQYTGIILAQNQSSQSIELLRKDYQDLYSKLSVLQKSQVTENISTTISKNQSFAEMDGRQKAAMIGQAAVNVLGAGLGAAIGANTVGISPGAMLGGQLVAPIGGFIASLAPVENRSESYSSSRSTTIENKAITDMMGLLDEAINRTNEFDSYGVWTVAGYFSSDDMATAEIAASNYRSLMNGEQSGREVSAINSWRRNNPELLGDFQDLMTYLSRFAHPQFIYGSNILINAATTVSGKELGLHLGLPRKTVPGLPVIEHAEFGKEVYSYTPRYDDNPENRLTLGKVFDLGQITDKVVELDNRSLSMHTFITGSTGSGKSNTVYQILSELRQDKKKFLVIEPAKGEYKDVFGNYNDVNVFSTNPNLASLVHINPFVFPNSVHVLEHIDGLVEIFSVCWPMYDAMPAFFKEAILQAYEVVGWDLISSRFEGEEKVYPNFEVVSEELENLIDLSDYASDIKSNYRGALLTRVRSLTVGLNRLIFSNQHTSFEQLFDENCILDISRIKSAETRALIMGLTIYALNEHRQDQVERKILKKNQEFWHATIIEEAHNLLKNTSQQGDSSLIGKSVEMVTNTIAEIRTYGEGVIIVDQSPSAVDIAAIKNTNTKIILRTPEANDREAIGRSIGLTVDQVNEIAKLPKGVAVVYQNEWLSPVLTKVDKAPVKEGEYQNRFPQLIQSVREARSDLISVLLQAWLESIPISKKSLLGSLELIDVSRKTRNLISYLIDDYAFLGGKLIWSNQEILLLQGLVLEVLGISQSLFEHTVDLGAQALRDLVISRTNGFNQSQIDAICHVLTKVD